MVLRLPSLGKLLLIILTVGEIALVGYLWKMTAPLATRGALSKNGNTYVLRWENSDRTSEVKMFSSPGEAIEFAKVNLNLEPGTNPRFDDSLETLWVREEMGKKQVFWKTWQLTMVHRLTFENKNHARVFETLFRKGAYSPSPIGHAIYLKSSIH